MYVHGLFMDGASWSIVEGTIVESAPKKLFSNFPVILVSAHYKTTKKSVAGAAAGVEYGAYGGFECPVYKYAARTDRYKIFSVLLPSKEVKPIHWILRGVALLCQTS